MLLADIPERDLRAKRAAQAAHEWMIERATRHAVILQGYTNKEVSRVTKFLDNQVFPHLLDQIEERLERIRSTGIVRGPWTTKRLADLTTAVNATIRAGVREVRDSLKKELRALAVSEAEWTAAAMKEAIGFEVSTRIPNLTQVRAVVTSRPMMGKFLRDWAAELSVNTRSRVNQAIKIGIAEGAPSRVIARRLRGTRAAKYTDGVLQTSRNEAQRLVRNAVKHVSEAAREMTYAENADLVKGVKFLATLDSRTSDICMSLDGQVYPIDSGNRPPMHHQCRSTTVPVLKTWDELGIKGLRAVPEGMRAAQGGPVSASTTSDPWLKAQKPEVQDAALGKGRAEVFRRGRIGTKDLVHPHTYKRRTLADLIRLEKDILAKLN